MQITYKNGEYCREGVDRRVKLQIYCDHLGRLGVCTYTHTSALDTLNDPPIDRIDVLTSMSLSMD